MTARQMEISRAKEVHGAIRSPGPTRRDRQGKGSHRKMANGEVALGVVVIKCQLRIVGLLLVGVQRLQNPLP